MLTVKELARPEVFAERVPRNILRGSRPTPPYRANSGSGQPKIYREYIRLPIARPATGASLTGLDSRTGDMRPRRFAGIWKGRPRGERRLEKPPAVGTGALMGILALDQLMRIVEAVGSADDLTAAMIELCAILGVQYFALTHHVDILNAPPTTIRIHNYPDEWVDYYDRNALGVSDPVHRASQVTSIGFRWSAMPNMIPLTRTDREILAKGREQGIGDGFTVPANVPGEAHGSCSFANSTSLGLSDAMMPLAQLAGAFAFEAARRILTRRNQEGASKMPLLTDRQRDCILWAARGKSDWEISRILGVSEETVIRHVKQARERYGVHKRTLLLIRALFDGTMTFDDVLWWRPGRKK